MFRPLTSSKNIFHWLFYCQCSTLLLNIFFPPLMATNMIKHPNYEPLLAIPEPNLCLTIIPYQVHAGEVK